MSLFGVAARSTATRHCYAVRYAATGDISYRNHIKTKSGTGRYGFLEAWVVLKQAIFLFLQHAYGEN